MGTRLRGGSIILENVSSTWRSSKDSGICSFLDKAGVYYRVIVFESH